jgi:L-lactate dehydrogenase complex protein LldG
VSSKNQILAKLKRQIVDQVSLPEVVEGDWIRFDDPPHQFAQMVAMVGGTCDELSSLADLPACLEKYEQWRTAERIFSAVEGVAGNVDLESIADPHDLDNLDFVVYPGEFAVAENGAIWLSDRNLRHRVVFFLTQYLVLVVSKDAIVQTMHEAYARRQVPTPGFGLFLSGPSKTADIEQSLVIGAHGCRELQVYLV